MNFVDRSVKRGGGKQIDCSTKKVGVFVEWFGIIFIAQQQ